MIMFKRGPFDIHLGLIHQNSINHVFFNVKHLISIPLGGVIGRVSRALDLVVCIHVWE